ncbi:hypothetical protein BRC77_13735 [Halobacteriales archaeon QH_8_64_26]|nr:MAG: hypothetical protein BRC77_13735 [Halobacteriales archaeon QH_8_64_26]
MANIGIRIIWFLLIGWWLGPLWAIIALLCMVSIIGTPLGAWMLATTGYVTALAPDRGITVNVNSSDAN